MIIVDDYKRVWDTMLHPGTATTKNMGVMESILYFWKGALIPFIIVLIETIVFGVSASSLLSTMSSTAGLGGGIFTALEVGGLLVSFIIITPIVLLIYSAIVHVIGRLLGFKGNFSNTFAGMIYGETASYSLQFIPLISIIGAIWGIVVGIIGVANQNKVSWIISLIALIIPVIVIGIIAFLVVGTLALGVLHGAGV